MPKRNSVIQVQFQNYVKSLNNKWANSYLDIAKQIESLFKERETLYKARLISRDATGDICLQIQKDATDVQYIGLLESVKCPKDTPQYQQDTLLALCVTQFSFECLDFHHLRFDMGNHAPLTFAAPESIVLNNCNHFAVTPAKTTRIEGCYRFKILPFALSQFNRETGCYPCEFLALANMNRCNIDDSSSYKLPLQAKRVNFEDFNFVSFPEFKLDKSIQTIWMGENHKLRDLDGLSGASNLTRLIVKNCTALNDIDNLQACIHLKLFQLDRIVFPIDNEMEYTTRWEHVLNALQRNGVNVTNVQQLIKSKKKDIFKSELGVMAYYESQGIYGFILPNLACRILSKELDVAVNESHDNKPYLAQIHFAQDKHALKPLDLGAFSTHQKAKDCLETFLDWTDTYTTIISDGENINLVIILHPNTEFDISQVVNTEHVFVALLKNGCHAFIEKTTQGSYQTLQGENIKCNDIVAVINTEISKSNIQR